MTSFNVLETIVSHDLCIGCGACTVACPVDRLVMRLAPQGQYQPVAEGGDCIEQCSRCLQVCPFSNRGEDEDELARELYGSVPDISHTPETGYYLQAFASYAADSEMRLSGASGGLGTWILETLLTKGVVDRVVCVRPAPGENQLFAYRVCTSVDEIRASSKSCYTPVEFSKVLAEIKATPGHTCLVGLPCFLKGLRRLQRRSKVLAQRVTHTVGLVCGGMQNLHFADCLCALAGEAPDRLRQVTFRSKNLDRPANNFDMVLELSSSRGPVRRVLPWKACVSSVWKQEIFRPNPCLYCDDVFAEVADIVLADAWLPSYIADSAGTTLAVVRSPNLQKLLEDGRGNNQIELVPLPIEDAIRSQCDFATSLVQKRRDLAARMAIFNGSFPLPKKRDFGFNPGVLDRIQAWLACRVRTAGRAAWAVQTDPKSYMDVQRNIKLTLQAHRLIRRLNALKRRVLHS